MTESITPSRLTIFYDARCPLCVREMDSLRRHDHHGYLQLENLYQQDFSQRFPHIDVDRANSILHGQTDAGDVLLGLDVTHRAWQLVGRHRWIAILRWPVIRSVADACYLLFARNRYQISKWLTGRARCEDGQCSR